MLPWTGYRHSTYGGTQQIEHEIWRAVIKPDLTGLYINEKVKKATLAFEDRFFYFHPGINPVALFRAARMNVKAGHVVSGGSTLTMQTIRLYRKGKPRTIPEKLLEMVMATRLELGRSKDQILSLYLSHAPYGGNVLGIEAASWRYFATSSQRLSWAEAATLAILPNAPSIVHPGKNRQLLLTKRNRLLRKIHELGWIDSGAGKIADIGSGWGALAIYLAQTCDVQVTALNVSPEQLAASRERARAAGPRRRDRWGASRRRSRRRAPPCDRRGGRRGRDHRAAGARVRRRRQARAPRRAKRA